jgi:hypothetical protein
MKKKRQYFPFTVYVAESFKAYEKMKTASNAKTAPPTSIKENLNTVANLALVLVLTTHSL